MGVLACDRKGCQNIMCDYFSYKYGYLCYECKMELHEKININIEKFMETPKLQNYFQQCDWDDIVNKEFGQS